MAKLKPWEYPTIAAAVDAYWQFGGVDGQQHTHTWHCKQDCLAVVREMEAKQTAEIARLRAELAAHEA